MVSLTVPWKWLVLIGAFISRVVTTGTVVCLGVFYNSLRSDFETWSNTQISAIFSTATGLLEGTGLLASFLAEKYEPKYLVVVGGVLATFGVGLASQTSDYVTMIITLGVLNGFGQGVARCLMPVAVAHSFDEKERHVAMSLQNVGDGVGGLIFPIFFAYLIDAWGWRGAMLITAGVVLHLAISGATIPRMSIDRKRTEVDETGRRRRSNGICRNVAEKVRQLFPNVVFICLNLFFHCMGYYVFMTFIYNDLTERQGVDKTLASGMFAAVGGVSIAGRLSVSLMDNRRVPRWLIYAVMHIVRGLIVLTFTAVPYIASTDKRVVCYFLLCASFGMTDGITGALIPMMGLDLFGLRKMANVYGLQLFSMGAGALIGVPIAGAMKDTSSGADWPLMFSGIMFILAGIVLFPLFCTEKHYQLAKKEPLEIELDGERLQSAD